MDQSTFDTVFTTQRLQMLKILLPCLPPGSQGGLAVYIKMQELLYTVEAVRGHSGALFSAPPQAPLGEDLIARLMPYCDDAQKERLRQFQQMSRQMENLREMMDLAQMMQEMFPEGMQPENMDPSQIMGMFSGMGFGPGGQGPQPDETMTDNREECDGSMDGR